MFLENVGHRWGILERPEIQGAIFRPSAQNSETCLRRNNRRPGFVLFDPQLYLLDFPITPEDYSGLIANLSTFPWFGMAVDEYESDELSVRDWRKQIKENAPAIWTSRRSPILHWSNVVEQAVRFQLDFGCSKIILPAVLLTESSVDLYEEFARLDLAIEIARELTELPLIASIPLSESAIQTRSADPSMLLEALTDSISAREEISGAYVVLASCSAPRDRIVDPLLATSVLRLCHLLGNVMHLEVIVNFAESLGLLACACGATHFCSGYGLKSRRLCYYDYRETTGGQSFPKFFSMNLFLDLLTQRDISKLIDSNWLHAIEGDETLPSASLFQALNAGVDVGTVPDWAETPNNTRSAAEHYSALQARHGEPRPEINELLQRLRYAEACWRFLSRILETDPLISEGNHISVWLSAVEGIQELMQ